VLVALLNGCGSACCPLAHDRGPINDACAFSLYGPPVYSSDTLDLLVTENPWTVKVREGDGLLSVAPSVLAAQARPGAVRQLHAFKGIPPCDVADDGSCR
jgi:hypothetical protein